MTDTTDEIFISNNITEMELWLGIGGHFDNYSQILCEFIDNSIFNYLGHPRGNNVVRITIQREDTDTVFTRIEDAGTGIQDLNSAFTLGSKTAQESPMNEHGFGLKHALASADPENDCWNIYTDTYDTFFCQRVPI